MALGFWYRLDAGVAALSVDWARMEGMLWWNGERWLFRSLLGRVGVIHVVSGKDDVSGRLDW